MSKDAVAIVEYEISGMVVEVFPQKTLGPITWMCSLLDRRRSDQDALIEKIELMTSKVPSWLDSFRKQE